MGVAKTITCYDVHGRGYEVAPDKLVWRPSAYAIVIKDGQLLTAKHFKRHNLPGGGIDLGETPEEALVREVQEETGLQVRASKFITAASQFFAWEARGGNMQYYQTILLYYACEYVSGDFSMDGFDDDEKIYAEMPEWYPLDKLDSLKYTGTHDWRPIVKSVMSGS